MNSIAAWSGAIAIAAAGIFHPQISGAESFTGADFLKWSEASQVAYLQNAIIVAMTISSRMSEAHATCISTWFFDADGFREGKVDQLTATISDHATYDPSGVLVAIIERECGAFGG